MILDYSVPNFSFLIGTEDVTDYIDTWSLESPLTEIGTPQLLTGQFTISLNKKALEDGKTESFFSEFANPNIWQRGQQKIIIKVRNLELPVMRIDKYRWNKRTRIGSGNLVQLPTLFAVFANKQLPLVEAKLGGNSLTYIISQLLAECRNQYPNFIYDLPNLQGTFDQTVYFDDAIGLCQDLAGKQQYFMWCDHNERLRWTRYGSAVNFTLIKSLVEFEDEPNIDGVDFFAELVKVGGSKDIAKIPVPEIEGEIPSEISSFITNKIEYTDDGLPLNYTKVERKTWGELFKNIRDADGNGIVPRGGEDTFETSLIETHYFTYGQYRDGSKFLIRELVVTQKLQGEVYSDLVDNDENPLINSIQLAVIPVVSEIVEITAQYQRTTLTKGEIYGRLVDTEGKPTINSLGIARQTVTFVQYLDGEVSSKPPYFVAERNNNPNTGEKRSIKPDPVKEPPEELPDLEFETEIYLGVCRAIGAGFNIFLPKELRLDVGFLPSQTVADQLACFIKDLELSRRNSSIYTMPIPDEWLTNHGLPFQRAHLDDAIGVIDGWAINVSRKRADFSFTLNRQGTTSPVPVPSSRSNFLTGIRIIGRTTTGLNLNQAIIPFQFEAIGGTAPYSWAGSSLPTGLSLSSGGLLTGTPTSEGNITSQITVTDALSVQQQIDLVFYVSDPTNSGASIYGGLTLLQSRTFQLNNIRTIPGSVDAPIRSRTTQRNELIDHKFWFKASEGLTLEIGDLVTSWQDRTLHGYDLLQATSVNKPRRGDQNLSEARVRSYIDMRTILATPRFLKSASIGSLEFTLKTLYMVIYQANWGANSVLFEDDNVIASASGGRYGILQNPSEPKLVPKRGMTGVVTLPNVDLNLGVWSIITATFNNFDVSIRLNKNTSVGAVSTVSDNWNWIAASALRLNSSTNPAGYFIAEMIGRDTLDDISAQNKIIERMARRNFLEI